jgi:hypothetical protein
LAHDAARNGTPLVLGRWGIADAQPRRDELQRLIELRKVTTSKPIERIADVRIVKISGIAAQEATLGGGIVLQVLKDRRQNDRVLPGHTQGRLEIGGRSEDSRVERYNRSGVEQSGNRILQTLAFALGTSNQYRNEGTEIIWNCTICS